MSNTDTSAAAFGSTDCCPLCATSAALAVTSTAYVTWPRTSLHYKADKSGLLEPLNQSLTNRQTLHFLIEPITYIFNSYCLPL